MESNLKQAFGKALKQLRLEKGVSQQELADNCDMERAHVSRLERGEYNPTIAVVFKIAEYFEIKPGELINQVDGLRKRKK